MKIYDLSTIDNGVRVAESRIKGAGYGLFASKFYRRADYITLYDGEIVSRKEAWQRPCLTHMAGREGVIVDGLKEPIIGRGGGSFANGSRLCRDANAQIVAWLGYLVLRAKEDIQPHSEIILHYGRRGFDLAM
tara:strand:+ start:346 stop:744 length:399 start_codon:yes stop_codon:yes gene_type:complete